MPNSLVDGVWVSATVRAVGLNDYDEEVGVTDETVDVVLEDDLTGVLWELDEEWTFHQLSDEQILSLSYFLADRLAEQITDSLVEQRITVHEAEEVVDLIERYEDGDQDWEL